MYSIWKAAPFRIFPVDTPNQRSSHHQLTFSNRRSGKYASRQYRLERLLPKEQTQDFCLFEREVNEKILILGKHPILPNSIQLVFTNSDTPNKSPIPQHQPQTNKNTIFLQLYPRLLEHPILNVKIPLLALKWKMFREWIIFTPCGNRNTLPHHCVMA